MDTRDDGKKSRWDHLKDQVLGFTQKREQFDGDVITLIYYACSSKIVLKCAKMSDASKILISNQRVNGGTAFLNPLRDVYNVLETQQAPHNALEKRVFFLSDGEDGSSKADVDRQLQAIDDKYSGQVKSWWNVGFGPHAGSGRLLEMANVLKKIKGEYKAAVTADQLQEELDNLASIDQQDE